MTDTGAAVAVLTALRSAGIHVALDDFGTGFASLRSLHELPIDVIKIDRSFLINAGRRTEAESMLEAIVTLGRSLGLDIIAEGIETPVDLERLTKFGIAGQGFLFARPLSSSAAAEFRGNKPRRPSWRPPPDGVIAAGGGVSIGVPSIVSVAAVSGGTNVDGTSTRHGGGVRLGRDRRMRRRRGAGG